MRETQFGLLSRNQEAIREKPGRSRVPFIRGVGPSPVASSGAPSPVNASVNASVDASSAGAAASTATWLMAALITAAELSVLGFRAMIGEGAVPGAVTLEGAARFRTKVSSALALDMATAIASAAAAAFASAASSAAADETVTTTAAVSAAVSAAASMDATGAVSRSATFCEFASSALKSFSSSDRRT